MSYKRIDRGIFEVLGPTGLSILALKVSSNLHNVQTRYIYHYSLIILIATTLFFSFLEI